MSKSKFKTNNEYTIHAEKRLNNSSPAKEKATMIIEAQNQDEALSIAGNIYGSTMQLDETGKYVRDSNGLYTIMSVDQIIENPKQASLL